MHLARKAKKILLAVMLAIVALGAVNLAPVHAQEQPGLLQRGLGFVGIDTDALSQKLTDTVSEKISSTIAEAIDSVNGIIASIFSWIIKGIGSLLSLLIRTASSLFAYNNYGDAAAVNIGWTLVRDVGNIFFLLVLLVVAIATILRIESYNLRKLLPKILIMAVLVNFSKTIAELFIDFSQIIMLQFVNAFHATFEGQFYNLLGINDLLNAAKQNPSTVGQAGIDLVNILTSYMLATILLFVILVAVLILMGILVVRMVALWMLTLFSPVAYLAAAFPRTEQYAKQWWQEFVKYLVIGPFLAFWIWLALAVGTVSITDDVSTAVQPTTTEQSAQDGATAADLGVEVEPLEVDAFVQRAGGADVFVRLVVMLVMLFVGMKMTLSVGGAIGSVAGAGLGAVKGFSKWYGKRVDDTVSNAPARVSRGLGATIRGLGHTLNRVGLKSAGQSAIEAGQTVSGFGRSIQDKFRFRSVPAGYRKYRERVEAEALGSSNELTEDMFNKIANKVPLMRGTESNEYERSLIAQEAKIQKEKAETLIQSEDQDNNVHKNLDKNGQLGVDEGSRREAIGTLRLMVQDRNMNDFVHHYLSKYFDQIEEKLGVQLDSVMVRTQSVSEDDYNKLSAEEQEEFVRDADGTYKRRKAVSEEEFEAMSDAEKKEVSRVGTYTNKNVKNILRYMTGGDAKEAGRIGAQLSKIGVAAGEDQLFGLTTNDKNTGRTILTPDSGEYGVVEFSTSLKEGQEFARKARAEQFMTQYEYEDANGEKKRGYGGFRDFMFEGDGSILERLASAMIEHPNRVNSKGAKDFLANKDLLIKQVAASNISQDKKDLFYKGMATLEATMSGKNAKSKVAISEEDIPIAPESTAGQNNKGLTNTPVSSGATINHEDIYNILGDRDGSGNVDVGDIKAKVENHISNELGIDLGTTQGKTDAEKVRRDVIQNLMAEIGDRSEVNSKAIESNTNNNAVRNEQQLRSDMMMLMRDMKRFETYFSGINNAEAKRSQEYYKRLDALMKSKESSPERTKNINALASEINSKITGTWQSLV